MMEVAEPWFIEMMRHAVSAGAHRLAAKTWPDSASGLTKYANRQSELGSTVLSVWLEMQGAEERTIEPPPRPRPCGPDCQLGRLGKA